MIRGATRLKAFGANCVACCESQPGVLLMRALLRHVGPIGTYRVGNIMCLLALLHRSVEGVPILLAANREESYGRPATGPMLFDADPRIVCGIDRRAGGTWLGLNQYGVVVAVTNRARRKPVADRRSRGLLCFDLLRCSAASEAASAAVRQLETGRYDGCNVLCVDGAIAHVVHAGDALERVVLAAGLHVMAAGDVDDALCPRLGHARSVLARRQETAGVAANPATPLPPQFARQWLTTAAALCAEHAHDDAPAICLHDPDHGTVSSSLIAVPESFDEVIYRHADGPPCRTPYVDYSHLARQCLVADRGLRDRGSSPAE